MDSSPAHLLHVMTICVKHQVDLRGQLSQSVEVGVFRRGWVTLSANFSQKEALPTNHCRCQKTRVTILSCGIKISAAVHYLVLSQSTCATDRQTNKRTDSRQWKRWPVGPLRPCWPRFPVWPVSPTAPWRPVNPVNPVPPANPVAPASPVAPRSPGRPAKHPHVHHHAAQHLKN